MNQLRHLLHAPIIADGIGTREAPGAILIQQGRIIGIGSPQDIGQPGDAELVQFPTHALIPALVNAHSHLDLSHIGPKSCDGSFTAWVDRIRSARATSPQAIRDSVCMGARLSRVGGTAIIGDIAGAGSTEPLRSLRECGLAGVSYVEFFGLGTRQTRTIDAMAVLIGRFSNLESAVALGLQPHAPYSCGLEVYRAAATLGMPLATHLAETLEEIEFVRTATGPLEQMIKRFGVWDETIRGCHCHPIDLLEPILRSTPLIAAHLNYVDDAHIQLLARCPITVAYCPRASAYFGHPHPGYLPHQYQEMLDAGVNVALGTDSLVCLDTPDRISVLDEMRLLHRRDSTDPVTLLRMATVNGAKGLGFDPQLVTLRPGPTAGILAIDLGESHGRDPLRAMLLNDSPPQWAYGPVPGENSWRTAPAT